MWEYRRNGHEKGLGIRCYLGLLRAQTGRGVGSVRARAETLCVEMNRSLEYVLQREYHQHEVAQDIVQGFTVSDTKKVT